jgi:hypothetical protein
MNAVIRRIGPALVAAAATMASALTLLAAVPGAASAAAGSTAAVQPATTPVQWHKLTLINHWQADPKFYHTGNAAWAVRHGVVYLRGVIDQSQPGANSSDEFAVLPLAARPARKLKLIAGTEAAYADLTIYPSGAMFVGGSAALAAKSFTSLDGISFPAAPTTGHKLTLMNGWITGNQLGTGHPAFWKEDGTVHLLGATRAPNGVSNDSFAVLPPGARPARMLYINTYGSAGLPAIFTIGTDGTMTVQTGQGDLFTSLAGISFPAAPVTGHPLTLLNGWVSSQSQYGTGDPGYWVENGIVHLLGSLKQPGGTNSQFAVLPPAIRPAHYLWIPTYTNNGAFGWLAIFPDGKIFALGVGSDPSAQLYTSLATISYPVNS